MKDLIGTLICFIVFFIIAVLLIYVYIMILSHITDTYGGVYSFTFGFISVAIVLLLKEDW